MQIWNEALWGQFGAAIDMLENAVRACPDELWADRTRDPQFWYVAYHTLFFLDYYLSESPNDFKPPAPFTLDELDPAGIMPPEPFRKEELLAYLEHGRTKCRSVLSSLSEGKAAQRCAFERLQLTIEGLILYNLRHVQHHAGQLHLILRQNTGAAPRWVRQAGTAH
jgi:DinB family protein